MIETVLINFTTAYIEFLIFLFLFCKCFLFTPNNKLRYYLIGIIPALLQVMITYSSLSSSINLLLTHIILFFSFRFIFHRPFLHLLTIYILNYLMIVFFELIQIPLWNLCNVDIFQGYIPVIGIMLVLAFVYLISHFLPFEYINRFILNIKITMISIILNCFFLLLGIVLYIRLNPNDFFSHYILFFMITIILLVINVEGIINQEEKLKQQKELEAYQNYLPIINNLIDQIRFKQHDYNNQLQSIRALGYTCSDYDTLKKELLKNTDSYMLSNHQIQILKLNLHLVAGFLVYKENEAALQSKQLITNIQSFYLTSNCTEYELIDCFGILIDNALEASPKNANIFAHISTANNQIIFEISNPGDTLTPDFCRNIFKKDFTTKKTNSQNHGIGLYKLNTFVTKKNGRLLISNKQIDNISYISFKLII